jgi:hypothetical protein
MSGSALDPVRDEWMPLMDYAMLHGVSLSTLRRHIKARKIEYRIEGGRYLLPADRAPTVALAPELERTEAPSGAVSVSREGELERALLAAREEIAELKMLVALYEETLSGKALGSN